MSHQISGGSSLKTTIQVVSLLLFSFLTLNKGIYLNELYSIHQRGDIMFDLNISSQFTEKKSAGLQADQLYDVIVIGGGPAGLNAALYAKRKGLRTGIIAERIGGQVLDTTSVENYLGFDLISGEGLIEKFRHHITELNIPISKEVRVEKIENGTTKTLHLSSGDAIKSKTVILATGSKPRELGVPGESDYRGKGVAYCAICDGPFFTDRKVIVAGGGNSAVEAAIDLSKIAKEVILIHRSDFRADQILIDRISEISNIQVRLQTQITQVNGEMLMTGVNVLNKKDKSSEVIEADGIFIEIGYLPNSDAFKDLVSTTDRGEIIVNEKTETNIEGIYAAGDVATVPYKQIIIAASEGAKAALSANDYINKQ